MARNIYGESTKNKVQVTLYLPKWVRKKLKQTTDNQSVFVERTLIEHHGWVQPGKKKDKE